MTRRQGFTLAEILVAVVMLGIVGIGVSNLLMSQTRFFSRATGARDARAVVRNALNIVRDEMRMIEPVGITAASTTSIRVRVPYAIGVYCSASTATFVPVDSLVYATAVFRGYAYRDTTLNANYVYVPSTTAPAAGVATNCTGTPGITPLTFGRTLLLSPAFPSLPAGAPVLLYQTVTYTLAASTLVPGRTALWRQVTGGASEEIAVPFQNTAIFRFYVSGGTASQASAPGTLSTISGIELVLIGESERNSPGTGTPESSAVRLSIFFRNSVI